MARRGRFTNPNAGGQNLSALIVSLLRERKSAEEQLLLQKFRNKEISAEEMLAFYDNWARTSGYTEGTLEYDQLNQRKKDTYDTGVKYEYDTLLAEFNSTGGGNYSEMMDFLNGKGQSVNDRNTRQQYLDLRKNVTNNFISAAADQLASGQIDLSEFRTAINAGIDGSFEKGTKEYYDARYSAFVAEYNGEYNRYQNRIKAGKSGAYGELLTFVKQMKQNLIAAGIDPKSDLYTRLDSDLVSVANAGRTAGSNAQIDRATSAGGVLGDIYAAALATSGVPGAELTADDLKAGKTYDLGQIAGNPAAFAAYIRLLENGVAEIPQTLKDKYGIESVEDLRRVIDDQVRVIDSSLAAANAVNPTDANRQWAALGKGISMSLGTRTQVDEISDAMNQYATDVANAGAAGDDVALNVAAGEWKKFLEGQTSAYGQVNRADLMEQLDTYGTFGVSFKNALKNTTTATSGGILNIGDQSLEDFFGVPGGFDGSKLVSFGTLYSNGVFPEAKLNYDLLTTGQKVQVITRDPATGAVSKVTTDRVAAGPTGMLGTSAVASKNGGYLTVITYVDGINGTKVPIVQSIAPTATIQTPNGSALTPWGYKYVLSSGKQIWVTVGGKSYDTDPFASSSGVDTNGVVFSDGKLAPGVEPLDSVPAFDFDSILDGPPKGYAELRTIAEKLEELTVPGSAWADALGVVDIAKVQGQIGVIKDKANKLEITEIETRIFRNSERGVDTLADQGRLKDLQNGTADGYNYTNFVLKNKSLYTEVSPGVYKLNEREGIGGTAGGYGLLGPQVDAQGRQLPSTVDISLPQNKPTYTGPNPFTVGLGGTGFLSQGSVQDTKKVAGDVFDFFRNKPTIPTAPSYLGSNYQGGAPALPPTISPPTISPALTPFNAADPEARQALISAQTQTTPPRVLAPPRIGGK